MREGRGFKVWVYGLGKWGGGEDFRQENGRTGGGFKVWVYGLEKWGGGRRGF